MSLIIHLCISCGLILYGYHQFQINLSILDKVEQTIILYTFPDYAPDRMLVVKLTNTFFGYERRVDPEGCHSSLNLDRILNLTQNQNQNNQIIDLPHFYKIKGCNNQIMAQLRINQIGKWCNLDLIDLALDQSYRTHINLNSNITRMYQHQNLLAYKHSSIIDYHKFILIYKWKYFICLIVFIFEICTVFKMIYN